MKQNNIITLIIMDWNNSIYLKEQSTKNEKRMSQLKHKFKCPNTITGCL